jgi:hypothetical protein
LTTASTPLNEVPGMPKTGRAWQLVVLARIIESNSVEAGTGETLVAWIVLAARTMPVIGMHFEWIFCFEWIKTGW